MSKVSEQKALETYSENWYRDCEGDYWDANEKLRKGYIKGYDQAFQDFMEKAESFIENKVSDYFWWNIDECFVDFEKEDCLEQFKNYMQDEN